MFAVLVCGCAGADALETTGAFSTLAPSGTDGDTDGGSSSSTGTTSGAGDTMPSTAESSSTDAPTSGPAESEGGDTTTGSSTGGSTGEPQPPQPVSGWWSHCLGNADCSDGLVCMLNDDETDGVCTDFCSPAQDPTSCGVSPSESVSTTCLEISAGSVCALDCAGGMTCPSGMVCLMDTDNNGPIAICL
jgi:hypothetical protein